jgi:hypothetical protein
MAKMLNTPLGIGQDFPMHLVHVSNVAAHEHLSNKAQRLRPRLGSTFVVGEARPRFHYHNFTPSLQNGQYIEDGGPLDHAETEQTLWGKVVSAGAIIFAEKDQLENSCLKDEILSSLDELKIIHDSPSANLGENGIIDLHLTRAAGEAALVRYI